jgi:hypothetical protein
MAKVAGDPLFYLFFIYGMSFIFMSYALFEVRNCATSIPFIPSFSILVLFGVTHGLTELTDWARFIFNTSGVGEPWFLKYISQSLLVISFVILLQFGFNLLTYRSRKKTVVRAVPAVLFLIYLAYIFRAGVPTDVFKAGLIARHGFGFTGSALGAFALLRLSLQMRKERTSPGEVKLATGLALVALGFAFYAVFGGLIVEPVLGVPVQFFRSLCALAIAASSYYILVALREEVFI